MKLSERLKKEAAQEDNDFKALALIKKSLRESSFERWEEYLPRLILKGYTVVEEDYKYTISTAKFGILDYFPKANKLLIRKKNKWLNQGYQWIKTNL